MHHSLHAGANRLKTAQPQQIERSRTQRGHHPSAIAAVAVGVLVELGVTDPVPALNAPSVPHQLQQSFWGCAQAGVAPRGAPCEAIQMGVLKRLAVSAAGSGHLQNPAGANPALADVLRCLLPRCGSLRLGHAGSPAGVGTGVEAVPPQAAVALRHWKATLAGHDSLPRWALQPQRTLEHHSAESR